MRVNISVHHRDDNRSREIPDQTVPVVAVEIGSRLVSDSVEVFKKLMLTNNPVNQAVFDTTVYYRLDWLPDISLPPAGEDQRS